MTYPRWQVSINTYYPYSTYPVAYPTNSSNQTGSPSQTPVSNGQTRSTQQATVQPHQGTHGTHRPPGNQAGTVYPGVLISTPYSRVRVVGSNLRVIINPPAATYTHAHVLGNGRQLVTNINEKLNTASSVELQILLEQALLCQQHVTEVARKIGLDSHPKSNTPDQPKNHQQLFYKNLLDDLSQTIAMVIARLS